jgi:hypothetical protein
MEVVIEAATIQTVEALLLLAMTLSFLPFNCEKCF